MLSDGLTSQQAKGEAREEVEVLDVAQMLLASVKGESATRAEGRRGRGRSRRQEVGGDQGRARAGRRHPDRGHGHGDRGRRPAAKASGGSSLFDIGGDEAEAEAKPEPAAKAEPSGGSLFDIGGDEPEARTEPEKKAAEPASSGGSLFDIAADEPEARTEPEKKPAEPRPPAVRCSTSPPTSPKPRPNRSPRRPSLSRPEAGTGSRTRRRDPPERLPLRHRRTRDRKPRANRNPRRPSLSRPRTSQAKRTSPTPTSAPAPLSARRRLSPPATTSPRLRSPSRSRRPRTNRRERRGARARRRARGREAGGEAEAGEQRRGTPAEDRRRHQRVGLALRPLTVRSDVVPLTPERSEHGLRRVRRGAQDPAGARRGAARDRRERGAPDRRRHPAPGGVAHPPDARSRPGRLRRHADGVCLRVLADSGISRYRIRGATGPRRDRAHHAEPSPSSPSTPT